jgi:predicted transposase YbfD/YdcC
MEQWPVSATIIAVCSHGSRDGNKTDETTYHATSLRTGAKALMQLVRQRWSIENSWHWVRDCRCGKTPSAAGRTTEPDPVHTRKPGDQRPAA